MEDSRVPVRELAIMKSDPSFPIQRIGDALVAEGFVTLDEQAKALGLSRSTTYGHNKLQQRRFAARLESMRRRGLDERDRSTA